MDFIKDVPKDRMPHALALIGPATSARDAAWELAGRLVCEQDQEIACGRCGSCLRIAHRQHEGVLTLEPDKGVIKLEAAARIAEFLGLKRLTRARVILVEEAQSLNAQTTNAILKLVEEPPEATYFILMVADLSGLLPTLRSRLQVVRLPVSARTLSAEETTAMTAATEFLSGCLRQDLTAVATWLDTIEDRADAERSSQALQRVLREWSVGGDAPSSHWPSLSPAVKTRLWEDAFHMEQDLKAHVDRTLIFENFFYRVGHELG